MRLSRIRQDRLPGRESGRCPAELATAGFTLVEVLVAMCVLSVFAMSTGYFFRVFGEMRVRERTAVSAFVSATEYVEKAVAEPPPCRDTNFTLLVSRDVSLFVGQTVLPGRAGLLWLSVEPVIAPPVMPSGPVRLGRLVYCR